MRAALAGRVGRRDNSWSLSPALRVPDAERRSLCSPDGGGPRAGSYSGGLDIVYDRSWSAAASSAAPYSYSYSGTRRGDAGRHSRSFCQSGRWGRRT